MASEFSKNCTTDSLKYLATYNLVCFALNSHTSIHINYNRLCIYARLQIAVWNRWISVLERACTIHKLIYLPYTLILLYTFLSYSYLNSEIKSNIPRSFTSVLYVIWRNHCSSRLQGCDSLVYWLGQWNHNQLMHWA